MNAIIKRLAIHADHGSIVHRVEDDSPGFVGFRRDTSPTIGADIRDESPVATHLDSILIDIADRFPIDGVGIDAGSRIQIESAIGPGPAIARAFDGARRLKVGQSGQTCRIVRRIADPTDETGSGRAPGVGGGNLRPDIGIGVILDGEGADDG